MRTYKDGGAAAVLNHTGDSNKGVELPLDIEEDAEKGSKMTGLQRLRFPQESQIWNSVRKSVADGGVLGKLGIERMKEFKVRVNTSLCSCLIPSLLFSDLSFNYALITLYLPFVRAQRQFHGVTDEKVM
jgi:hypothetical protein